VGIVHPVGLDRDHRNAGVRPGVESRVGPVGDLQGEAVIEREAQPPFRRRCRKAVLDVRGDRSCSVLRV
jgi:hypothetical protein